MTTANRIEWNAHPPPCWDGWRPAKVTWAYNQAFAPNYQIVTWDGDVTAQYTAGLKIKLTQNGATKYFILMIDSWYAVGATAVDVYGGSDGAGGAGYTLDNSAITDFQYSTDKAPVGWPMNPLLWTERVTDVTIRGQTPPVTNTWYNLGGVHIHIPFGIWRVRYQVHAQANTAANKTLCSVSTGLSTNNNTVGSLELKTYQILFGPSEQWALGSVVQAQAMIYQSTEATVIYYLNTSAGEPAGVIFNNNETIPAVIEAECAYL